MALRIRGQEATIRIIVDGNERDGSFHKLENFKLTPKDENPTTDFLGEKVSSGDYRHDGYEFAFTTHEEDKKILDLHALQVANEEASLPPPDITIIVITKYRDPANPSVTVSMEECVMKLDDRDAGGRKDYVKNAFSGFAPVARIK